MELVAERLVAGGAAIAHDDDGRVVFVEGALPGERVAVTIVERRRDFLRAVVDDVVDPSSDRVGPPCAALADGCGGCAWQHVRPEAQLGLKAGIVADALRRIARLPDHPEIEELAGAASGYRTTVRLAVDREDGGRLGYRRHGSHELVVPSACLVLHPSLEELLVEARFPEADEVVLRVSAATGERIALVTGDPAGAQVPADVAVAMRGSRQGMPTITEVVSGRELRVSAPSFFQPGPGAAELLVEAVGPIDSARAADLYGGVGLFAATVMRGAGEVTVVERSKWAAADARHNVPSAHVVRADVEAWRPKGAYDVVVADPARTGLGSTGVQRIIAAGAGRVVLVSCDPAAMARDARLLAEAGFALRRVLVVDTFAHTAHVETVTAYVHQTRTVLS